MAFFHQPERQQPFLRAPAIVLLLIALLLAAHAARVILLPDAAPLIYQYGFIPARYSQEYLTTHFMNGGNVVERSIPFVSYMFLHADWTHVGLNSIWLLPFGSTVARRYGGMVFLLFFFLCGLAGAAVYLALNWGSASPVIGASAAVSGMMGVAFRVTPGRPEAPLHPLLSRPVVLFSLVWILINIVAGVTGFGTGPGIHLVAWQAHIGGYFAGLLLAGPFDHLHSRAQRKDLAS